MHSLLMSRRPLERVPATALRASPPGRVIVRARHVPNTGYGIHAEQLCAWFSRFGAQVEFAMVAKGERMAGFPLVDPDPLRRELLLADPGVFTMTGSVFLTMWESSRLKPGQVDNVNQAQHVIVPCRFNRDTFAAQTRHTPTVIPMGINTAVFHGAPWPSSPFVFATGGRLRHGTTRKQVDRVVDLFLKAFPHEPDVRLDVKCHHSCGLVHPGDPRVRLLVEDMTEFEMAEWQRSAHAFISLSRGEGWGMFQHQSLACGRPVACPFYGGVLDFLTEANAYPVPFKLVQPDPHTVYGGAGEWALADEDGFVDVLRHLYHHPDEAAAKGAQGSRDVAHLTWERHARAVLRVLEEQGAYAP